MKKEMIKVGKLESYAITPQQGKALVRRCDNARFVCTQYLGYAYYLGGVKLDTPHRETPEDYTEEELTEEEKQMM